MNRCQPFLTHLAQRGYGAALISQRKNIFWLTGYRGEGLLLVTGDAQVILTDSRFEEQARQEAPECRCVRTSQGAGAYAAAQSLCDEYRIDTLCVETNALTYDQYRALEASLQKVSLVSLGDLLTELRRVKDAYEIRCMEKAAEISCRAFENILNRIHAGMTEKQIQHMLDYEMLLLGSEGNAFPTIVAAGLNGALPHAIPSDYALQKGDLITLDFGGTYGGYCSDMTRTIGIGQVSEPLRAMYEAVLDAQLRALQEVRPGALCSEIDRCAREPLDERYPGAFGHGLGHGVGLNIHELPRLHPGGDTVLQAGHVITVEPGVYLPGFGGCRIEDMVIMTSDGYINPITITKQLLEL
ncbi:MAG: aminopeptidase P family protein [Christensenellales bacterium]|nr:aminopeptidase P family protein [Christensenellales bacterium]